MKTIKETSETPEFSTVEFNEIQVGDYVRPVLRPEDQNFWLKVKNKTANDHEKFLSCSIEDGYEQYPLRCLPETEWVFEKKV